MYTQLRWSLNVVLGVDKFLAFPFNKTNFIQSYRMLTQVLYCDQPMSRTDMAGGFFTVIHTIIVRYISFPRAQKCGWLPSNYYSTY